jgi:monolysocardiolipin acyltransferase
LAHTTFSSLTRAYISSPVPFSPFVCFSQSLRQSSDPLPLARLFSAFFSAGQVLDTVRGAGVHQPAVDRAIQLVDTGAWIHLFGEGKVVQPRQYAVDEKEGKAKLIRFKWGV